MGFRLVIKNILILFIIIFIYLYKLNNKNYNHFYFIKFFYFHGNQAINYTTTNSTTNRNYYKNTEQFNN